MTELLARTRTAAVHWLQPDEDDGLLATVCGTPIPYVRNRSNVTTDCDKITCKSCHEVAFPPFNPYAVDRPGATQ